MPATPAIELTPEQRTECRRVLDAEHMTPHVRQRALILLLANCRPGERFPGNESIAQWAGVDRRTVARVRRIFHSHGFTTALRGDNPGRLGSRKLSPDQEVRLLALLDTPPPPGYPRWTVRTLAEAASELEDMPTISRELVRRLLKRQTPQGRD